MTREERDAKLQALLEALPGDACNHHVWYMPSLTREDRGSRDWLDEAEPIVCGRTPATPTDAPQSVKYGMTRLCDDHGDDRIFMEQLNVVVGRVEEEREASRAWLERNGHHVYTAQEMWGED